MAMYLGKERAVILSQKYTTEKFSFRKTPDFGGLSQSTLFRVKKVKGATVKCNNLIPYPYTETTKTMNGITFTDNGDGSITVNGTATAEAYFSLAKGSKIKLSAGQYTISGYKTGIIINAVKNGAWWGQNGTLTFDEGDVFNNISVYVAAGRTINNVTVYPMLNEGETALPYQPYFTGLKHAYINSIKSTGKNLIPYPYYEGSKTQNGITFTDNGDGSITVNGTATANTTFHFLNTSLNAFHIPKSGNYHLSGAIDFGSTSTYFLSVQIRKGSTFLAGTNITNKNGLFFNVTDEVFNTYDNVAMYLWIAKGQTFDNTVLYPMFNQGETAFPFEPYKEDIWQLPETLELGEWDELNPQTGELKRVDGTIERVEGCPLAYKVFQGGTESVIQGEVDNSQFGAIPTIETGQTVAMELIIGDD